MSEQSNQTKFGEQQFSEEERGTIRKLLEQKLGKEHISYREGPGQSSGGCFGTTNLLQAK